MNASRAALVLVPMLAVLGLALTACRGDSNASAEGGRAGASSRPLAADFTVSTGGSSTFSLSEHKGEIVVLYFSFPG